MFKFLYTFLSVAFIGLYFTSIAQEGQKIQSEVANSSISIQDPVLMEIGDRKIKVSEFEAVYRKNNQEVNEQSLSEYLDLYVNFRLKVADAESQGLDTLEKFKRELSGYRKQLAEPYLSDNEVTEELVKEAYDRLQYELRASHILIKVGPGASPEDTLTAYRKIMNVKKRLEKGEDFATVAREVDPDARENGGDLGYFTALYMVYPFESACYNAEIGKVTDPVRTSFGYHLIKVVDKRENRGEITVEHIMTKIPQEFNMADKEAARMKIDEIYAKLQAGENFEELASQYSDDKGSSNRGGLLPPFSSGRMVPEFEAAAFALENDGDYTKPVETVYGYHIIKRIRHKPIGSFEEMEPELKHRIARDGRSRKSKVSFLNRMKEEYGWKEYPNGIKDFHKVIDSTFFHNDWNAGMVSQLKKPMFKLGDSTATQTDFAKYLEEKRTRRRPGNIMAYVNRIYAEFKEDYITSYEDVRLEQKYIDFKLLMQEYHDGILLFDLTDEKVWSKAVKDSAGLVTYYEAHKDENTWGQRLEAVVYSCSNIDVAKTLRKSVKARSKKGYSDKDLLEMTNKESQLNLEIERDKFSKGDNEIVDQIAWSKGISDNIESNGRQYFVEVINVLDPQPKELNEVKGLMTSGYQSQLEEEWLSELKKKYPVKIYNEYLSLIK